MSKYKDLLKHKKCTVQILTSEIKFGYYNNLT